MSQSSVAQQSPEDQTVISKSLTELPEGSRVDSAPQTEPPIEQRSPTLETSEGREQQSHAKPSDAPQTPQRQAAMTEPLGEAWIRKYNDDDDDDSDDNGILGTLQSISFHHINHKLSIDNGPLSNNSKNKDFIAFIARIDSSINDYLSDIEKLYSKISDKLRNIHYFRKSEDYKEYLNTYIECRKKYFREYKAGEVEKSKLVQTARESLDALRECLLDMNFECFAETEQGSEIALLEEKARFIYQGAIDEVPEEIDQRESLYADFLSHRNAFLLDWNMPEDGIEQEEYTEQEIHAIHRMKESLQKYIDGSRQEVKRSYEQSLDDEQLLNQLIELLTQKDSQDRYTSSTSYDLENLKEMIKDIKSLHQNVQKGLPDDYDFQEAYYEKYHEYTNLIDQLKKGAASKTHDHDKDGMETQDIDNLEQSYHAPEIYDKASEVLFQLMDIREVLLERCFECFAETEQGQGIAQLEEQTREIYWGTTDHVREKADQEHDYYADFLSHRNAFLQSWKIAGGKAKQEKYTKKQKSYIDKMKESLHHYIEWYQQEVKISYEQFLADEAFHERLLSSLSPAKQQEIRRLVQSRGLKDAKRLLEDVRNLHRNIYEEWHGNPDFQHQHAAFQEEYYEQYNECHNLIDQFKGSRTVENFLKVIMHMIDIRHFLLTKTSNAFFLKTEPAGEIVSREERDSGVYQRQPIQSQAGEKSQQAFPLRENEASAIEKHFEAFLKNEQGKPIDGCLEEINMYLSYSKDLRQIIEKELNKFEYKRNEIFDNYDKFLVNTDNFKKRQIRELYDQILIAKIKIEERLYVLFLHHQAGQATQQLEEKYRAFADTIDFLFDTIPLDLQNTLRVSAKEYNIAKAELVKQLVRPESAESNIEGYIEKLNQTLAEQIAAMKEKIWSQFRVFWSAIGIKEEINNFLLLNYIYKQGKLEKYIEEILHLSEKISDELYQNDVLREALKKQFASEMQKSGSAGSEKSEAQRLDDAQSVYDHLVLLHRCMMADCANRV